MSNVVELNNTIVHEADTLLNECGLVATLERFGRPFFHGSYSLKLMTWRDLDVYLRVDKLDTPKFFDLGREIAECLKPSRMNFRNELGGNNAHLPAGLYWGSYATINGHEWKIDLWAMDEAQFQIQCLKFESLQEKIPDSQRPTILTLKAQLASNPDYRRRFFSVDIYEAVFDGVASTEEFYTWLEKYRGLHLKQP